MTTKTTTTGTAALDNIVGHCTGHPDVRHVDNNCNGTLWIDGTGTLRLPTGFGFANSAKFQVDAAKFKLYIGTCEKCKVEGSFIRDDVKPTHSVVYPKLQRRRK